VRAELDNDEMARLLLVIRSANDSRTDIARYLRSAHAALPKRGFAKMAVLLSIAPMWRARFPPPNGSRPTAAEPEEPTFAGSASRSLNSLDEIRCGVSGVVGKLCYEISAVSTPWHKVKRSLVTIKGELASLNAVSGGCEEQLAQLARQMEDVLKSDEFSFRSTWPDLLGAINSALARTYAQPAPNSRPKSSSTRRPFGRASSSSTCVARGIN
jgi:HPt (histidine-containing phosphotransfer) domain-containing protein